MLLIGGAACERPHFTAPMPNRSNNPAEDPRSPSSPEPAQGERTVTVRRKAPTTEGPGGLKIRRMANDAAPEDQLVQETAAGLKVRRLANETPADQQPPRKTASGLKIRRMADGSAPAETAAAGEETAVRKRPGESVREVLGHAAGKKSTAPQSPPPKQKAPRLPKPPAAVRKQSPDPAARKSATATPRGKDGKAGKSTGKFELPSNDDLPPPADIPKWEPLTECGELDLEDVCLEEIDTNNRYTGFETLSVDRRGPTDSCYDRTLDRKVQMKSIHPRLRDEPLARRAVVREARLLSRLKHPAIPSVFELALRTDGTIYFTKDLPSGQPLHEILDLLAAGDQDTLAQYPLRRRMEIFCDLCAALAHAHSREVVHAHLSPAVITVREDGRVVVDGWSNAILLSEKQSRRPQQPPLDETALAVVAYEAPESVERRGAALSPASDIYSLGAILYALLALEPPFSGSELSALKSSILEQDPPSTRSAQVSASLDAIVGCCMEKERQERYDSVEDLIEDVTPHGIRTTGLQLTMPLVAIGLAIFVTAASIPALIVSKTTQKEVVEVEHAVSLDVVESRLVMAKARHDELRALQARYVELTRETAERALSADEQELIIQLRDKHGELLRALFACEALLSNVEEARRDKDWQATMAALQQLEVRQAVPSIDKTEPVPAAVVSVKKPEAPPAAESPAVTPGAVSIRLATKPVSAAATIIPLHDQDGVFVEQDGTNMGSTPVDLSLAPGSYVAVLEYLGMTVRQPLLISHGMATDVVVPLPDEVPEGTVFIASGTFLAGGDADIRHRKHTQKLPGFFMREREVTFGEFFTYWNDPDGGNRRLDLVPQLRLLANQRAFTPAWNEQGVYVSTVTAEHPVVGVSHDGAREYCAWLRRHRGVQAWLPTARQWEKAARGVDGRKYVWGNSDRTDLAFTLDNGKAQAEYGFLAPTGSFEMDRSVYGVLDMAGNAREWTDSLYSEQNPFFEIRGASSSTPSFLLPCTASSQNEAIPSDVGFRYIVTIGH